MPILPFPTPLAVQLDLQVVVTDEQALRTFVAQQYQAETKGQDRPLPYLALPEEMSLERAVSEALIFANRNPLPEAYGVVLPTGGSVAIQEHPAVVRVRQRVEVADELALWPFALRRYRQCWGQEMASEKDSGEMTLSNAVLEAVVLSNCNPSPGCYGIEIDSFRARLVSGTPRSYPEVADLLE